MEDMARLALVEQNVRDTETFSKLLYELLRHIHRILDNPHDYELRTIKSEVLINVLKHQPFVDYLKSIGFRLIGDAFTYPKENPLSNLRLAQAAIERKIYFCCGSLSHVEGRVKSEHKPPQPQTPKLAPVKVFTTSNSFLLQIESMFNGMLKYEDEGLQELARQHIPVVTLQLLALDRMREHQRRIKTGESKGPDMAFDMALLSELLGWFKQEFFQWVDAPPCDRCGDSTVYHRNTTETVDGETCRVEHYRCTSCDADTAFPRYNSPRTLLRTRRGRCGEWANCFTLICRAMAYDCRYVYDTTDHVWCEVFDRDSNSWLHVDPCEGKLDTPLMYSHGWGKTISYVIALSRDDLQDVTWRYTTEHRQVLKRRLLCTEAELVWAILSLREARQRSVSEPRRSYLAKRTVLELVGLMVERKPSDYESHGRISGSVAWRGARGEAGAAGGRAFRLGGRGPHTVRYCCATDRYTVATGGDDGSADGVISWRVEAGAGLTLSSVTVTAVTAEYDSGRVAWTVAFDDKEPDSVNITNSPLTITQRCVSLTLTARLSGGSGDVAWQHAQLARQRDTDTAHALEITCHVDSK